MPDAIVVDASALFEVLARPRTNAATVERLVGAELHAPHLLDPEVLAAARAVVLRGALPAERAATVLDDLAALRIERYPHGPLVPRAWELRGGVSSYDGIYVALAEALGCPLLTADRRLARSHGPRCVIEAMTDDGEDI